MLLAILPFCYGRAAQPLAGNLEGMSVTKVAKILASTDLRSSRLRLVIDEKTAPAPLDKASNPLVRHHILVIEPGNVRFRYDILDYGPSGRAPFISSSFSDGLKHGRWDSGLTPEVAKGLLANDPASERSGGICYLGANVCRSPDIILRVFGLTASGKPVAEMLQRLAESGADVQINKGTADGGVTIGNKYKRFVFDADGTLKEFTWSRPDLPNDPLLAANNQAMESIKVLETGKVAGISVPTKIIRKMIVEGRMEESLFELRRESCSVLDHAQVTDQTDPLLPLGTIVTSASDNSAKTLEQPTRAFAPSALETPSK